MISDTYWTVYDLDEGGKFGKQIGRFPTEEKAKAYVEALGPNRNLVIREGFSVNLF